MEKKTPVLGFAAYSGTGKTTLLEKLIPELTGRGLKIAMVKHDAHGLTFDHEGKDSWRFSNAGAMYSIVNGPGQSAIFMNYQLEPEEAFQFAVGADLIMVEGYKQGSFSQVGISRKATGKGLTGRAGDFCAVVTDDEADRAEAEDAGVPVFDINDVKGIADFIEKWQINFRKEGKYERS